MDRYEKRIEERREGWQWRHGCLDIALISIYLQDNAIEDKEPLVVSGHVLPQAQRSGPLIDRGINAKLGVYNNPPIQRMKQNMRLSVYFGIVPKPQAKLLLCICAVLRLQFSTNAGTKKYIPMTQLRRPSPTVTFKLILTGCGCQILASALL